MSRAAPLVLPPEVADIRDQGGLFAINHSGGKDSQAMTIRLLASGIARENIVIVHATLGRIEWPGTREHIEATTAPLPLIVAEARTDFFAMVRRRGYFPTPSIRQCTSDLKRGPIQRELRRHLKANPRHRGLIVNCVGLRAEESRERAGRPTLKINARQSVAGRTWLEWLPIQDMTTREVFRTIRAAGQRPHWVYAKGMARCSCSFCIMATRQDLATAARLRPDLPAEYEALEREVGHTLRPDRVPLGKLGVER